MDMNQQSLESRNIPGVTAKGLVWIMGGIISLIIMVMWSYFNLMSATKENGRSTEILSTQFETFKADMKTVQANQQQIDLKIAALQYQILELQNKNK